MTIKSIEIITAYRITIFFSFTMLYCLGYLILNHACSPMKDVEPVERNRSIIESCPVDIFRRNYFCSDSIKLHIDFSLSPNCSTYQKQIFSKNDFVGGYANEWKIFETLIPREKVLPKLYTEKIESASIILSYQCGVELMHDNRDDGRLMHEIVKETFQNFVKSTWRSKKQALALVLSHDHGRKGLGISPSTLVLQNSGDYSDSLLSHSTITVIPFLQRPFMRETSWYLDMKSNFRGISDLRRFNKIYFAGTVWPDKRYSYGLRQEGYRLYHNSSNVVFMNQHIDEYFSQLLAYRYCFLIPGWSSWSHRLTDIIMSGCIPVIVFDRSRLPFEDITYWHKFSIFISEEQFLSKHIFEKTTELSDKKYLGKYKRLLVFRQSLFESNKGKVQFSDCIGSIIEEELCRLYEKRFS